VAHHHRPVPARLFLGPLQIRFYGISYAIAFIVGTAGGDSPPGPQRVDSELSSRIAFWTIVFGLIGARLYYDVQSGCGSTSRIRSTSLRSGKEAWRSSAPSSPRSSC